MIVPFLVLLGLVLVVTSLIVFFKDSLIESKYLAFGLGGIGLLLLLASLVEYSMGGMAKVTPVPKPPMPPPMPRMAPPPPQPQAPGYY